MMQNDRRRTERVQYYKPVQLNFGIQVSVTGKIRDISEKSAFIDMKSSLYVEKDDEFDFKIFLSREDSELTVEGKAKISRVATEGVAIYFTHLSKKSHEKLLELIDELRPTQRRPDFY
ncbi:MAG: PilZ domain-containing protein [Candidatus Omnitrophica bacterium]|nr:PilZ domain-containing protein [Candidatus Omnitrophota bacterium]